MRRPADLIRDERGASAVEFVLVLPILLLISIGTINLCLMLFAVSSLHHSVEEAARCASIKTAVCSDPATTRTYAQVRYTGPKLTGMLVTPSLNTTCGTGVSGNQVVAAGSFSLKTGIRTFSVPLSATACYPS